MSDTLRDEGTGKIRLWTVFDRVAKVATVLILPLVAWTFRVEVFMQQGPRVTPEMLTAEVNTLRAELIDRGQLPLAASRLTALERGQLEIKETVDSVETQVQDNALAIARLGAQMENAIDLIKKAGQ